MDHSTKISAIFALTLCSLLLSACSTSQIKLQSDLVHTKEKGEIFVLKGSVKIKALHAKQTILKPATRWHKIGSIDKGVVYNTNDQIIIVNSYNVYEGYIVVNQNHVVGYYLPTEKTFVPTKPVTINLVQQ